MFVLQNIVFPSASICSEHQLFFRARGACGFDDATRKITLGPGGELSLSTYFNVFNLRTWLDACDLQSLSFVMGGSGTIELQVVLALPDRSWDVIHSQVVTLKPNADLVVDLASTLEITGAGFIFVKINAIGRAQFHHGRFVTMDTPQDLPELAVSITTFRREQELAATMGRLVKFLDVFEHRDHIKVQVVDNGGTAEVPVSKHIKKFENANLGGAGGFARGLKEAKAAGYSHCLFMDDDASFDMENLLRTYAFLAFARDPKIALAGAMITNTHKWAMWENGAVFDGSCRPRHVGLDLRDLESLRTLLFESNDPPTENTYGGWWFFAFTIANVEHFPFPFFVRGDDISFSLANDFRIHTLNGVVSFQDDFAAKESPLTLYLDLRNHLLHHLTFEPLDRGALGTAKIALRFILRSVARFHYESASAQMLAVADVMQGPEFFLENADMSDRRAVIKEMTTPEAFQDDFRPPDNLAEPRWSKLFGARFWVLTLNGHFLPFHEYRGAKRVIPIHTRGALYPIWGACEISYFDKGARRGYTVRQSKRRGLGMVFKTLVQLVKFVRAYPDLKKSYRTSYAEITSERTWDKLLGFSAPEAPTLGDE